MTVYDYFSHVNHVSCLEIPDVSKIVSVTVIMVLCDSGDSPRFY
jgi:hypothetical protein